MPRAKKPKKTPPASEATLEAVPIASTAPVEILPPATPSESLPDAATSPVAEPESPTGRGQFRTWVVDESRGYTRMSDVLNKCTVLQFADKPPQDILSAVKGADFQFKADYHGQREVWVRRDDFEGRLQVEAIEKLIRAQSVDRASLAR